AAAPARRWPRRARERSRILRAELSREELQDRRRGLLDRAAADIDHRPAMVGEEPARLGHFLAHLDEVGVLAALVAVERGEALGADLDQPVGIVGESDHERPR